MSNIDLFDQRCTHLDSLDTNIPSIQTSSRRLARCLQDVFRMCLQDVFKTSWRRLEDVFKRSWRRTNVCWVGISPLTSFISASGKALVAQFIISGILSWIFFILALYTPFLTTSFFTTWLCLLKSTGTGTYLSTSNFSTLLFKLFTLVGIFFNLPISTLPTSGFKLAKSTFLVKDDVSIPVPFLNLFLLYS